LIGTVCADGEELPVPPFAADTGVVSAIVALVVPVTEMPVPPVKMDAIVSFPNVPELL
jgi:hypothetical protein